LKFRERNFKIYSKLLQKLEKVGGISFERVSSHVLYDLVCKPLEPIHCLPFVSVPLHLRGL
jgi:hypothetical protein